MKAEPSGTSNKQHNNKEKIKNYEEDKLPENDNSTPNKKISKGLKLVIQKSSPVKKEEIFCAICLDVTKASDKCQIECCNHKFCFECISDWAVLSKDSIIRRS